MIQLVRADNTHISIIQNLASDIWWKYYPSIIGYKQVQYMLDKFYSEPALLEQMNIKKHQFFLISWKKKNIGFISIEQLKNKKLFIHKFYILQSKAHKGIGTKVFRKIVQIFQPKEARLTVNRQNFKAINFYFKNKFVIEKVEDFDIGNGFYMNDFVMVWRRKK